jgi:hypothetical protein
VDPGCPACILGQMRAKREQGAAAVKKWTLVGIRDHPRREETRTATIPCAQSPGIEASAEAGS